MAVSHRHLISQPHVRSWAIPCEMFGGKSVIRIEFLRVLGFSPFNIVPPVLHAHLHLQAAVIRTKGQRLKTLKKQRSFGSLEAMNR